jgi:hypothetical protein
MMLFVLNVVLFCSLWSSIFARPLLATAPLFPRGMRAAQHAWRFVAHHSSQATVSVLMIQDFHLQYIAYVVVVSAPPTFRSLCHSVLAALH